MVSEGALRPLVDDLTGVPDEEVLIRVIPPKLVEFLPDGPVPQSNAYQDQSLEVARQFGLERRCASVALKSVWEALSGDFEDLLRGFDHGSGLTEFSVGHVRRLVTLGGEPRPQGVMPDPRPGAPWHAVMWDEQGTRSKGAKRALAELGRWIHFPSRS